MSEAHHHVGEEVDYNEVETSEGKSREERLKMYMDAFINTDMFDTHQTFREFASSRLDMIESGGFDGHYSNSGDEGMMMRYYDPPTVTLPAMYLDELTDLCNFAIEKYNQREGTNYGNVHVLKANTEPVMGTKYYLTFKAFDKIWETFQARVYNGIPTSYRKVELVRVRIPLQPLLIIKPRGAARSIICRERQRSSPVPTPVVRFDGNDQIMWDSGFKTSSTIYRCNKWSSKPNGDGTLMLVDLYVCESFISLITHAFRMLIK